MSRRPQYYPISALKRDHYGVLFPIGPFRLKSGETIPAAEVAGFRVTYRKGQANERVVWRVKRGDGSTEDLPRHLEPTLFRPAHLNRFPDPLPDPAALTGNVRWRSEHPEPAAPEEREDLVWPAAVYSEPGKISEKEAEIRILRAWKTQRSADVDAQGLAGPAGFRAGRVFGARGDVRVVAFEPSRRDVGDWPVAMGWFTRLRNVDHKAVIDLRSQDYSFRQIGERLKKGVTPAYASEWARTTYRRSITELTAIANRIRRGATP